MPTSIHLPKGLREAVERRARRLGVSRNRLIVTVLQKEIGRETQWSPGFLERLTEIGPDEVEAIENLLKPVRRGRTHKAPR
jgi:hypothetical protein